MIDGTGPIVYEATPGGNPNLFDREVIGIRSRYIGLKDESIFHWRWRF